MKAHRSLDRLIVDMLAYDVLVFPCPDDDAEFDRWERNGWDPGLLARRVSSWATMRWFPGLGTLVRQVWESTGRVCPAEDRDDPEMPFMLTETVMADLSMATLMGAADDRFGQTVLEQPQIHAAFASAAGWPRARRELSSWSGCSRRNATRPLSLAGTLASQAVRQWLYENRTRMASGCDCTWSAQTRRPRRPSCAPWTSCRTRTSSTHVDGCGRGRARFRLTRTPETSLVGLRRW